MWTQRDQIQAYQFLRRRLVSALVVADANHPVSPSRRLVIGSALGVAATVLVVGGFGLAGVIHPSANPDWRRGGQVIVEKETGARYVLGQDQKLHPILNYASARLLAGGNGARTVTVAAAKLSGAPRGATLGLVGAPDSLPLSGRLLAGPWTACTQQPAARPAATAPVATLLLGPHAAGSPLGVGAGVVVRTPSGTRFLLSGGQRFRIADELAAVSLGYDAVPALSVAPAFVDAVPAGRDLAPITVPGAGNPGPSLRGTATRVGQVLQVGTVGTVSRYYLVRADGLTAITQTEAALVLGNPADAAAYRGDPARPLTASAYAVAGAPRSATPPATGYPDRLPRPIAPLEPGAALCAEGDGLHDAQLFTAGSLPGDQVAVPPGRGALVAATQSPGAPAGTTYLVTDTGRKYPVPSAAAVSALGYGGITPARVVPSVLALLPTGVTLDPGAAQQVVPGGTR